MLKIFAVDFEDIDVALTQADTTNLEFMQREILRIVYDYDGQLYKHASDKVTSDLTATRRWKVVAPIEFGRRTGRAFVAQFNQYPSTLPRTP